MKFIYYLIIIIFSLNLLIGITLPKAVYTYDNYTDFKNYNYHWNVTYKKISNSILLGWYENFSDKTLGIADGIYPVTSFENYSTNSFFTNDISDVNNKVLLIKNAKNGIGEVIITPGSLLFPSVTIELDIKSIEETNDVLDYYYLIDFETTTNFVDRGIYFYITPSKNIVLGCSNTSAGYILNDEANLQSSPLPSDFNISKWHHFTIIRRSFQSIRILVDGKEYINYGSSRFSFSDPDNVYYYRKDKIRISSHKSRQIMIDNIEKHDGDFGFYRLTIKKGKEPFINFRFNYNALIPEGTSILFNMVGDINALNSDIWATKDWSLYPEYNDIVKQIYPKDDIQLWDKKDFTNNNYLYLQIMFKSSIDTSPELKELSLDFNIGNITLLNNNPIQDNNLKFQIHLFNQMDISKGLNVNLINNITGDNISICTDTSFSIGTWVDNKTFEVDLSSTINSDVIIDGMYNILVTGGNILSTSNTIAYIYETDKIILDRKKLLNNNLDIFPKIVYLSDSTGIKSIKKIINISKISRVKAVIYDIFGKIIYKLFDKSINNDIILSWDIKDSKGNYIAPGTYVLKVWINNNSSQSVFTVLY